MRYLTSGESHGRQLTAIIEGLPAGMFIDMDQLNQELKERQQGYGRGGRMKIEHDCVQIVSGLRHGYTIGSPLTLVIENKDWKHWQTVMHPYDDIDEAHKLLRRVTHPRPGHADLVGGMKYQHEDLRNVLERSSARETAMRVAIGGIAKQLLHHLDIYLVGYVTQIGKIKVPKQPYQTVFEIEEQIRHSSVRCYDLETTKNIEQYIDQVKASGDTVGGMIETLVTGMPPGVGSYVHWDLKLDGRIAQAVMSIPAVKGISFGDGQALSEQLGSQVMDEIYWQEHEGFYRKTNHLGGIEGGMSTGNPIVIQAIKKPIPTLYKPLNSVDIHTKDPVKATVERSDTCAVPAASKIMESLVATVLAQTLLEQFPADRFDHFIREVSDYRTYLSDF